MLTECVREDLRNAVLCWLATVDSTGLPNVSPKEIFAAHGDGALLIADIASPISVRNIGFNPRVCVSFVDVFRQRGYKITGTARLIAPDEPEFEAVGHPILLLAGADFRVRHIIYVEIERVGRILAPSYLLFPDRSIEEHVRRAHETYKVAPRK